MRALVVGATGFLGLNLVEALRDGGHDVVATRRASSNTIFLRRLRVPLVTADLSDPESLTEAMRGREVVFLAAGHYPRYHFDREAQVADAVAGIRSALDAARRAGVARLVYTGSAVTVRRREDGRPAREDDGMASVPGGSTYFAVKLAMEAEVLRAAAPDGDGPGLDVVAVLPSGCLGPYDWKVGTGFFVAGLGNRMLDVWLDGRINVVDARDVARGHILAAERGRRGARYLLGGHDVTVRDLLALVAARLEVPLPTVELTPEVASMVAALEELHCHETGRGRPLLSREIVDLIRYGQFVDSSRARDELGFTVRPLEETIAASAAWYRANGFIRATAATAATSTSTGTSTSTSTNT